MSSGERAAENTKGFFKGATGAAESLRQNINSFADGLIGGKSNTHSNTADTAAARNVDHGDTHTTGATAVTHPTHGLGGSHDPEPAPGTLGTSDTSAGSHAGTYNTGLTGGGTATGAQTASGIHPDAERTGAGVVNAVERAGEKIDESLNHSKRV